MQLYLEDLGEDGGGEEGGVLDDDEVTLVLIGHLKLVQDGVCGLAHHHGAEELASQPRATAWGNPLLDDGHLDRYETAHQRWVKFQSISATLPAPYSNRPAFDFIYAWIPTLRTSKQDLYSNKYLPRQPCSDAYLHVGVLGELVCAGETGGSSAHNDDIGLGVLVQVLEVTAGHSAAHLLN